MDDADCFGGVCGLFGTCGAPGTCGAAGTCPAVGCDANDCCDFIQTRYPNATPAQFPELPVNPAP
jgi:hypothetical protein